MSKLEFELELEYSAQRFITRIIKSTPPFPTQRITHQITFPLSGTDNLGAGLKSSHIPSLFYVMFVIGKTFTRSKNQQINHKHVHGCVETLGPEQNGTRLEDYVFKSIFARGILCFLSNFH